MPYKTHKNLNLTLRLKSTKKYTNARQSVYALHVNDCLIIKSKVIATLLNY